MSLDPRLALEDSMIMSVDGFDPFNPAILIQVGHRGTLRNDIVVGLEGKLDVLLTVVKGKDEVKVGEGMYSM